MNIVNRLFVMTFCLCMVAFSSKTMAQDVQWKKNIGCRDDDYFHSATAVSDGVVAVGYSWLEEGVGTGDWEGITDRNGNNAIIVKYNNSGDRVWKVLFGSKKQSDYFYGVATVPGGMVAVGRSSVFSFGTGDWTDVTGEYGSATMVKFDNNGNVVWKKHFGGEDVDEFVSIVSVSDGFVVVGNASEDSFETFDWTGTTGNGSLDAIIAKFDLNGNLVWKKNFGGSSADYFYSVTEVAGGVIAVGSSKSESFENGDWTGVSGKGKIDAIIVKYDNSGNLVWKKNFGGNADDSFSSVSTVSDGVVAVGYSGYKSFDNGDWEDVTEKGDQDAIIIKFDNNGNIVWKKNFGGEGINAFNNVVTVSDGIVVVGYSDEFYSGDWAGISGKGSSDGIIIKFDNNGNVVWKKNFGGMDNDEFYGVTAASGGIVAVGYSRGLSFGNGDWAGIPGKGYEDAIIVKFTGASVGISETLQNEFIKISPNPTTGKMKIETGELKIENIEIYDLAGKQLLSFKTKEIDISNLSNGIYFMKLKTETGELTKKIIKE